jgi:hypothetical protein
MISRFRAGLFCASAFLTVSAQASAQIGLASGAQNVTLMVRVPEQASLEQLGSRIESSQDGSVQLRLAGSSGYRLVVRGVGPEASRLSVRSEDGSFQRLVGGAPITLARYPSGQGDVEYDVQYRTEKLGDSPGATQLPVRYDLIVDPIP